MTIVILAAGMGSRYGGLKQIDPIGPSGEFIIDYSCFDAVRSGFDRIVFVIKRENLEIFRSTVGARVEKKINVEYAFQELTDLPSGFSLPEGRVKPWGTAHALLAARNIVDDNFATINADDFYGRETFELLGKRLRNASITADGKLDCCMLGFKLGNTLTENGTVSRGICEVRNGLLKSITERTKIRQSGSDSAEFEEDGVWTRLPLDSVASMNCFGLVPGVFGLIENGFRDFLSDIKDPLKSEYYLPYSLNCARENKDIDISVEMTPSKWYGVTYAADKDKVKKSICEMVEKGEYPKDLWN